MSFSEELNGLMDCPTPLVRRFMALLEPVDDARLEAMAQESRRLTRLHFGRTIRLFAPIYLSNECINNCKYCGFSRDNPIIRTTLTVDEVVQEARYLHGLGLRSILLVAGEHPKFVSDGYMQECLDALHSFIPSLGLEIGPLPDDRYAEIVRHGAEQLAVYQETYNREVYETLHTAGMKEKFQLEAGLPGTRLPGRFPPHSDRSPVRAFAVAAGGHGSCRPSGLPAEALLEIRAFRGVSAHASLRRELRV